VRSDLRITPDRIPVGRFGRVEEVAEVTVVIAGDGYINGQSINVNGGLYPTSSRSTAEFVASFTPGNSRVARFTGYPVDTLWAISGRFLAKLAGKREISTG
jgi:hypothetical protein